MSSGTSAIGVGAVGFGVLLIYSAYTKKALFGPSGIIRQFITTGTMKPAKPGELGKLTGDLLKQYLDSLPKGAGNVPPSSDPPGKVVNV